jgi:16S rRNA (adenine1518-N6/adenine1519-N6)-dimethyltransferase
VTAPLTPATVPALLASHGIRPSRALGQHFLADPNTAARIVRLAGLEPGGQVVEVGAGIGSLTVALCAAGVTVTAVELDQRLADVLREVVAGLPVRVVVADAMRLDWGALLGDVSWSSVSNLPYNVATPLVVRALEHAPQITRFLVMVQREVGERLAAAPGDAAYGAVSVKVAYHCRADVVGYVPPTVFVPRPKVDSALVRLVRRPEPPVDVDDPSRMFELVRAGFATRRKTLRRALAAAIGDRATAVLDRAGIDPRVRAETLGLEEWAALARAERVP